MQVALQDPSPQTFDQPYLFSTPHPALQADRQAVAGLQVQTGAAREGLTPQAFVGRIAAEFEAMGEPLNARADDIVRTHEPRNQRASQEVWRRMAANGDVYLSTYSGWYSVRDE